MYIMIENNLNTKICNCTPLFIPRYNKKTWLYVICKCCRNLSSVWFYISL